MPSMLEHQWKVWRKNWRKSWQLRFLKLAAAIACVSISAFAQNSNPRQPLGSMQSRGMVSVGGMTATSETSLYPGDIVRTGPDGSGNLDMPGRGSLTLGPNTSVTFLSKASSDRLASLQSGNVALRFVTQASTTTIELGRFVLTTETNTPAAAEVARSEDGSAHIRCLGGSVGVIESEGIQALYLKPGEEAEITSDGKLRRVAPTAPPASSNVAPETQTAASVAGKSHTGLILLGVGGGVAGGVAALVATRHGQPMSPSAP